MGTGWADAAGAQSLAQNTGDITSLLSARLMAQKLAWAQQQSQAMDAGAAEKADAARMKGEQADFIARKKAMDPFEDRILRRDQADADLKFKREQEQRLMGVDAETGRHNMAEEGLKGSAQGETAQHNRVGEAQDWRRIKLEEAKNAGLSVGGDATAGAIANYQVPPPSARQLATPAGEALMQKVLTLNPSYRGEEFPTRAAMRKAFTSGAQSKTLNNLNTSIEHLDQIAGMADKLQNSSVLPWNAVTNYFSAATGNPAVTNFNGMKTILAGELAGAFKQTGATDAEINSVKEAINSSQSPQQLHEYIAKTAIPALGAKASTFGDQYRDVMGEGSTWSPYTPSAKAVLQKYGVLASDPSAAAAATTPAPAGAGPAIRITSIKPVMP
jgi:hypothetical protein